MKWKLVHIFFWSWCSVTSLLQVFETVYPTPESTFLYLTSFLLLIYLLGRLTAIVAIAGDIFVSWPENERVYDLFDLYDLRELQKKHQVQELLIEYGKPSGKIVDL